MLYHMDCVWIRVWLIHVLCGIRAQIEAVVLSKCEINHLKHQLMSGNAASRVATFLMNNLTDKLLFFSTAHSKVNYFGPIILLNCLQLHLTL